MPKFLEDALMRSFEKRKRSGKLKGVDKGRYVYGAMNKMGAMKGNKVTAKGRRMEEKHEEGME